MSHSSFLPASPSEKYSITIVTVVSQPTGAGQPPSWMASGRQPCFHPYVEDGNPAQEGWGTWWARGYCDEVFVGEAV